jgi:hypothetical protein
MWFALTRAARTPLTEDSFQDLLACIAEVRDPRHLVGFDTTSGPVGACQFGATIGCWVAQVLPLFLWLRQD